TGNPSVILSIKDFGLWDRINKKFEQELHLFSEEEHLHWLLSQYEDYFGIRKGFARDILLSLYYKQAIGKKNKKFWSEEFSLLNRFIDSTFIKQYLYDAVRSEAVVERMKEEM
ncbi:MAG: hypothetical protein ACK5KP_09900, partial [Paludibacteraceae bacterium]